MKPMNVILLIILSAIWGGSFIFMRVLAPVFGATGTACLRLTIAAVFLILYFKMIHYKIQWKRDWKFLCLIGVINSAIPFSLYAYAALHIPASISVVVNTLSPMFGALFAALLLKEKLSVQKISGLVLGTLGVAVISGSKAVPTDLEAYLSIGACLLATVCYGLSGVLIKKYGKLIEAKALAGGSQLFAGLVLIPFLLSKPPTQPMTASIIGLTIAFAVLCSAVAYLIYYYLLKEMGPTRALTVTFLMPVFGIVWGNLLLGEAMYLQMLFGSAIILLGTYQVVRVSKS